ncbi:cupin domain-containing protein [Halegenticoccus soli]|uniref:cupin domain-containing protein n=1 Tax=Halegenticoccus soli TaxID=1985678 RepID=UPI000C6D47CB|nr:cupin domain-containing protein [Halegenticoccus soli]
MYSRANLDDLESREIDGVEPSLKAVGYELRPERMRPSVWAFEAGESNNRHYQREQEELYHVLSGRFEMAVDDETFEIGPGEIVVVPPEAERQLTAVEAGEVFVVGAPNAKDDGVVVEE